MRLSGSMPIFRTITSWRGSNTVALTQVTQSLVVEPRGTTRLPALNSIDLSVKRPFKRGAVSFEPRLDMYNLTNAATVWGIRNRTEAIAFTDPTTGQRATLAQFRSPSQILVPRTVVLRAAFKF